MADASYARTSFVGGEFSKLIQGRYDRPEYPTGLALCLNGFPTETGAWVRRPGFQHCAATRNGLPGRLIPFAFRTAQPYMMEFTDGHLRFYNGKRLVDTNDSVGIAAVTPADPSILITDTATAWVSFDQVYFTDLGPTASPLHNRQFEIAKIDTTHFNLIDTTFNGFTLLDATAFDSYVPTAAARAHRILDFTTPYVGGQWQLGLLQVVQTETTAFVLHNSVQPNALVVTAPPTVNRYASFSFATAVFQDGPYLDEFDNGVMLRPNVQTGIVTFVLQLPTYDATRAYPVGAYVTSADVSYISLVDQNLGHTPITSPAQWRQTSAAEAVAPGGFVAGDIGRLVRLFSEPDPWDMTRTYSQNNIVSYNPSGVVNAVTYWKSLTNSNLNNVPGKDTANWSLLPTSAGTAVWTWGKIINIGNFTITVGSTVTTGGGTISVGNATGNMSGNGGLLAAFDGVNSKIATTCAALTVNALVTDGYVGRDFTAVGDRQIGKVTIYPSSDLGFVSTPGGANAAALLQLDINLFGKASAPGTPSDGTLLATTTLFANQTSPVNLVSTDTATAWKFVWAEIKATWNIAKASSVYCAQLLIYAPDSPGSGGVTITGPGIAVELLGSALLYNNAIRTWRLGAYSNTTGWPTCGTYLDGRLWLSGAIPNRIDGCVSNGIKGGTVNFAPTDPTGTVAASSAIAATFNAPDTNAILWMEPDQQGIICGTKGGEWLVGAVGEGGLTPFSIKPRRITHVGCANIPPARTDHTLVFVQKHLRKLIEYFADVFSGRLTAPNLTLTWKHLTKGGINEIAYQQELAPIVWVRRGNILLTGCTYKRNTLSTAQAPDIAGGHQHALGNDYQIESIAVGPSVSGDIDSLMMIVNSATTSVRHVVIMADLIDEDALLTEANFLDNAIAPTFVSSLPPSVDLPYGAALIGGLFPLEGFTVQLWAAGMDCAQVQPDGTLVDYTVTGGTITVPYGDGVSGGTANGLFTASVINQPMLVGFTFTSRGQIVRPHTPQETGARNGPGFAKVRRQHLVGVQLQASQGVSFGTRFDNMVPANFMFDDDQPYPPTELFSGVMRRQLEDPDSLDGMICWEVTRPYPCNIPAIGGFIQTQDQ